MRIGLAFAVCMAALAALASAAGGGSSVGPPPGGPDLAQMALRVTDFPAGARVVRQKYVKPAAGFVAAYEREFKQLSVRLGSKRLLALESDVFLARRAADAEAFVVGFELGAVLLDEDELAAEFTAGGGVKVTYVKLSRPFELRVGDASAAVTVKIGTRLGEVRLVLAALSVDRVTTAFYFAGLPKAKLGVADARRLGTLLARHIREGLIPINVSLPTVAGQAEVGQTLTVSSGTWRNKPATFAYQWRRCSAAGVACTPISGATTQTYVVSAGDSGSTLRVAVAARNSVGAATAISPPTAVVPPAVPPVNTALPTISGTATAGQTLTATTGAWTGAPTAFAFAWQRCDAAGSACSSIAGAVAQIYVVAGADVGSTIRVAVTATNASGSTIAVSSQTPVVT